MQVNFTRDEYAIICELADAAHTAPAWMLHDWTMDRAGLELYALKEARRRIGSGDEIGASQPIPSSNTIDAPVSNEERGRDKPA